MTNQLAGSGSHADCVQHNTPDQASAPPNRRLGNASAPIKTTKLFAPPKRKLKLVRGSDTVAQKVDWLWTENGQGRLPLGTLSVVAGDGNLGKSPFTLWLAAQITRGKLEGDLKGQP